MSLEDTIGWTNETPTCVVCAKGVDHGGGFARVNHKKTMVNLCCPLCMETFEKDPTPYMLRLEKILRYRSVRDSSNE